MKKLLFILLLSSLSGSFALASPKSSNKPEDFVPRGYTIQSKIEGDLNKDSQVDYVLLVKGTDKKRFVKDDIRGVVDRNRRGIIIAFKNNDKYELALENLDCFSSENEDGGFYFAPELDVSIKKGNLFFNYSHGRYGYWSYNFRHQKSEFELIGYENSNSNGPDIEREISINLLTKKALIKSKADSGQSNKLKESWKGFSVSNPIKLAQIKDFDDFNLESLLGLDR